MFGVRGERRAANKHALQGGRCVGIRAYNQAALGWPALSRVTWKARPSLPPHAGRGFRESQTLQESGRPISAHR